MKSVQKQIQKRKGLIALFIISLLLLASAIGITNKATAASKGFSIQNGKLMDANGQAFIMKGVNIAHTWYQSDTKDALKVIAQTGANTVRVVLSDGQQWSKNSLTDVKSIIAMCEENKLVCVLEVHDGTGKDDVTYLTNAANYFIEMKEALIGNEDTVIVNIANEWFGSWQGQAWANGYKTVIPMLRNSGIKNTIMVDCAGYGQYPASIHQYGKEVFAADALANTMFSIHMYEYAGKDASTIKSNIDQVIAQGLPLCIGEFGYKHTSGDVDENFLINYCEEKQIGWMAWSWYGNGGGVEYLDLITSPKTMNFTEWGKIVSNHTYGLRTAKICSVYQGTATPTPTITPKPTVTPIPTLTPNPTVTPKPTVTPTPTPQPSGKVEVTSTVTPWSGGYTANFVIKNVSSTNITNWKLEFNSSDFSLRDMWGAKYEIVSGKIIVTPETWNTTIAPNSTITFGFNGNGVFPQNYTYLFR